MPLTCKHCTKEFQLIAGSPEGFDILNPKTIDLCPDCENEVATQENHKTFFKELLDNLPERLTMLNLTEEEEDDWQDLMDYQDIYERIKTMVYCKNAKYRMFAKLFLLYSFDIILDHYYFD